MTFPAYHSKMKDFIILSQLASGKAFAAICETTNAKMTKVSDLNTGFTKGKTAGTQTMKSIFKEKMTAADWAFAYGVHSALNQN